MATLMDLIMQEYRGATSQSRASNADRLSSAMAQTGMTPTAMPVQQETMSPEEFAYSVANPDRIPRPAAEATGAMRAPSFQRLMQGAAMSQAINPARAAIGEQVLSQAQQNRAARQGTGSIYPFFGEPDILGAPMPAAAAVPPTPSATQAAQATRPQAPVIPATMFGRGDYNDVFNVPYTPAVGGNYNDVFNVPYTQPAAPRQRPLPEVLASRDERTMVPKREPGFFERIFSGTQYQSNSMPVTMPLPMLGAVTPEYINWGDPNRAADFFAADRALMQQNPAMFGLLGGTNG
jgi:hypothetical protein